MKEAKEEVEKERAKIAKEVEENTRYEVQNNIIDSLIANGVDPKYIITAMRDCIPTHNQQPANQDIGS